MLPLKFLSEDVLVKKACKGDRNAFGALYRRHGAIVFHLLRRLTANTETAEDLTQETFIAAFRSLETWRAEGSFSTWLCGIALRRYAAVRRSNFQAPGTEFLDEDSEVFMPHDDPHAHYKRREAEKALSDAIDALSESCREVYVLVRMENLPYQDVADILDIPIGTVRSRLNRATKFLHERLSPLIYGTDPTGLSQPGKAAKHVVR